MSLQKPPSGVLPTLSHMLPFSALTATLCTILHPHSTSAIAILGIAKRGDSRCAKFINRLAVAPCCHYALFVPPVIVNPVERCFLLPGFFFSVDRFCFLYLKFYLPFANGHVALRERPRCSSRTTTLPFANGK